MFEAVCCIYKAANHRVGGVVVGGVMRCFVLMGVYVVMLRVYCHVLVHSW